MENEILEQSEYLDLVKSIEDGSFKWNFSAFKQFCKSPRHFIRYKLQPKETKAMKEGTLLHLCVFEPDTYDETTIVQSCPTPSSPNQKKFVELVLGGYSEVEAFKESYSTKGKSDAKIVEESAKIAKEVADYLEFMYTVGERTPLPANVHDWCMKSRETLWSNAASLEVLEAITETEKSVEYKLNKSTWRCKIDGTGEVRVDL